MFKKVIAIVAFASLSLGAPASALPTYDGGAPIAYMVDANSGAVLHDKASQKRIPPASMAKMMTVLVAFDLIKKGEIKLDQKFDVQDDTWRKWNNQGSSMFLRVDDNVSVENLLHGIVTLSGNDACVVLAEGIAGTEKSFTDRMNAMGKRIGLTGSHFANSNGWPDEGRTYVTARDLGRIALATINDYPDLYKRFYSQTSFEWNGIEQANRDPLIGRVDGADGLKTGHTEEAGYGFTGSAEQGGHRLVMVVAGLNSFNERISESVKFINWGFANWNLKRLFSKDSVVAEAPVQLGDATTVNLVAPRDIAVTIPSGSGGDMKAVVRYQGPIKAPFAKGQHIADLIVTGSDMKRQTLQLVAGEAVGEAGIFSRIWAGIVSLFS